MRIALLSTLATLALVTQAHAEDYTLTLKNHKFEPAELTVPAGKQIKLIVKNEDSAAAEFESDELKREKVINPGESVTIMVGPLEAGTYAFEDEFHDSTAQGKLIVK